MSKTKSKGTSRLGRDSRPKYLGLKLADGQTIKEGGEIIVRQRGTKFLAGENVGCGRDHTLFALKKGKVKIRTIRKRKFDGSQRIAKIINVVGEKSQ